MQLKSKRAWILPLLATIISVIVVASTLAIRFLDLDTYKQDIVAQVKASLKRDLCYETGDFSLRYGLSFSFTGVSIKEKDGVSEFIKADRLTLRIALLPLLQRKLVLSRMQIERPELRLSREADGSFNIGDLLTANSGGAAPGIGGIDLRKAHIRFTDRALSNTPLITELSETDLYLSRLTRGKDCDFKLSGSLVSGTRKVPLFLAGVAKLPAIGVPFSNCEMAGRIRTGPLDAAHFWPYYNRYVPFKSLGGEFALEGTFKGRPAAFKSKGELKVTRLNLDYPQVFHARLTPKLLTLAYELELTDRDLDISSVKLNLDGFKVNGSCKLSEIHSNDLRITAKASGNRFNLRDFRQFIPYGIIVKDTADFIEQKIAAGFYKLDQGRLDGRISQILHMERGENYKILYVRAHVEEGVVNYGSGIPIFNGIKGELELAGKDFNLKGMSGNFGSSPLLLEGTIADFPLNAPTRYLFSSILHPQQQEVAWLIGRGHGDKLVLSDGGTLKLKGEGTTSLYNLSGDCDLSPTGYILPDLIEKPKGRPNTLSFKGSFSKDDFRLTGLTYNLAPLALSATAVSRYQGPVSVEVRTNQFQSAEVSAMLPSFRKYQPSGRVQAQLHGSGPEMARLAWDGNVLLSGVSFKAGDKIKPISGVNGSVHIGADSLETSQLSVRLGSSTISGRGSLSGFKSPTVSLSFFSPSLDLTDLGLYQGKLPARAEKVQGNLSYSKDNLEIGSLSGTLGKSVLQIKGSILDLQHPQMDLSVTSPHLELEDITPLFGGSSGNGSSMGIRATVLAVEGKAHDIPFQHLKCVVMLQDKILYLQPLDFSSMDGEFSGKMRIDFGSGTPRYQLNGGLQRASAERFMHAMGVKKQEITGTLSLQGELSAKGESALEIRRSLLGNVKLKTEHGRVRKFSTLSKVFSILNVSQLLKFQLPDMVSGGMPYNKIAGDLAFRDGSASTQNLFLDSNAINLSAIGKLDLVKNELNLTIGVQPLQSVDKVVSRIPIVGWILTGKDHSLITTYFEAKGPIEDPQVTAVPVKSLARGVLNIFKRVFELPTKLFTDTGEVVIGN